MAGILDSVDQRTQLVGENRLEILMFRLDRWGSRALGERLPWIQCRPAQRNWRRSLRCRWG
jgi:hypothetical protein